MKLFLVTPDLLGDIWFAALPFIRLALKTGEGEYEEKDIFDLLMRGKMQLWLGGDKEPVAAAITEIREFPQLRTCVVQMAAGEFVTKNSQDWMGRIGEWAKSQGCVRIEVFG